MKHILRNAKFFSSFRNENGETLLWENVGVLSIKLFLNSTLEKRDPLEYSIKIRSTP